MKHMLVELEWMDENDMKKNRKEKGMYIREFHGSMIFSSLALTFLYFFILPVFPFELIIILYRNTL
jgi:hypothetical protein